MVARPARRSLAAGRHAVVWNGRVGKGSLAHSGRYEIRVAAANRVGTATLAAPVVVRRVARSR
jgi:hypothetical protein